MGLKTSELSFDERVKNAKKDKFMRASVAKAQDAQFEKRTRAREQLGHWNEWRELGEQIRQHAVKHLPDYLEDLVKMSKKMADTFILPRQMLMQPLISNKLYVRKISKRSLNLNQWSRLRSI